MVASGNQQLPKYFSCEFFEKALGLKSQVTNYEASLAVGKGENYTSSLYRVKLNFNNNAMKSVIVKCCPEDGKMKEMLDEMGFFDKESLALAKFVPDVCDFLKGAGVGVELGAGLLHYKDETPACIILEDLKESGYVLADRKTGMDLDHCKLVFKKIARLHAAGKILYEKNSLKFKPFTESFISCTKNDSMEKFCNACIGATAEQARQWGEDYLTIADKLDKIKFEVMDRLKILYRADCPFSVVNHGDLWVNNMMFKYAEGQVEDVILLDFQCMFYASPAIDLLYFIYGSCNEDVFWNNRDELLRYYHDNLIYVMQQLQYDGYIPTLKDLEKELDLCKFMALYTSTCLKPILMHDNFEESDDIMDELEGTDTGKESMLRKYSNPNLKRVLKPRLKFMDKQGMLD